MKVRIGSLKYELIPSKENLMFGEEEAIGMIEEDQCKISISMSYPEQTKKQSFWHETVHGMFFELGQRELSEDEGLVDALGKLLYSFHEDNNLEKIYEKLT